MTVVKPLEYTAQFYESKDLKAWALMSEFGKQGDTTKIWECPSLVNVPIENSKQTKWLLMISSGHKQKGYLGVQYSVGDFDGKTFQSKPKTEPDFVDEGKDFYAAVPFYNLPKTQTSPIIMGWTNDWEYTSDIPIIDGYRGGFSTARQMSLYYNKGEYLLKQTPIVTSKIPTLIKNVAANEPFRSAIGIKNKNSYRLTLAIDLTNSKGFDLSLIKTEHGSCIIKYDTKTKILSFDRSKLGASHFSPKFSSTETTTISPESNILKLDILVDKSIIELYVNDGKKVITALVFPHSIDGNIELKWRK
jgi:fructan beta-fructosidase